MKIYYFDSFRSWRLCIEHSLRLMLTGMCKFIYAIMFGILDLLLWLWNLAAKVVKKYPKSTVIIILLAVFFTWLLMFVHYRSQIVTAEYQRDSTACRLQKYERMYDGNTDSLIIVRKTGNDTLTFDTK